MAAWVVSLSSPLIQPELSSRIYVRARESMGRDPARARFWVSGLIADIITCLPTPDPWRALSARIPVDGGADLVLLGAVPPPRSLGAACADGEFGTWRCGTDLVAPAHANLFIDAGLIALAEPLTSESAAVLAMAGSNYESGASALEVLAGDDGQKVLDIAGPALRWAIWRRQVYTGPEDSFAMTTAFMWLGHSRDLAAGQALDEAERQADIAGGQLADDLYEPVGF